LTLDPHFDSVTGQAAAWRELLPLVDAFLPSREEAQEILGAWPGAEAAASRLAELGAPIVCLKLGPRARWSIAPPTTGSGTPTREFRTRSTPPGAATHSVAASSPAWCESDDLRTAALYGTVSASFVASGFGAEHCLVRIRWKLAQAGRARGQEPLMAAREWVRSRPLIGVVGAPPLPGSYGYSGATLEELERRVRLRRNRLRAGRLLTRS